MSAGTWRIISFFFYFYILILLLPLVLFGCTELTDSTGGQTILPDNLKDNPVQPNLPKLNSTISPARDLTGKWAGTASFVEDNIFTGVSSGEVLCTWTGTFSLNLYQKGNEIIGYYNKGSASLWSEYTFKIKDTKQSILSQTGTVPPAGCVMPMNGLLNSGIDSGVVSSSSIKLNTGGKLVFSGSFTSDIMSLELVNCLLPSGDSCTIKDSSKWKITLTRQTD